VGERRRRAATVILDDEQGQIASNTTRHAILQLCSNAQTHDSHCGTLNRVDSRVARAREAGVRATRICNGEITMLYTIAVILLLAWLLGLVGTITFGPILHVLLVVAIVLFIVGLLGGRRTLA
jgi:hypothetical protein